MSQTQDTSLPPHHIILILILYLFICFICLDPVFLLTFLRCGKFSQLKSRERLTKCISSIEINFPGLIGSDPGDDKVVDIIRRSKTVAVLPGVDKDGKRVFFFQLGNVDTSGKYYTLDEWNNASWSLLLSVFLFDENAQVNGATLLVDTKGTSANLMTSYGLDGLRRLSDALSKAVPARIKGVHYLNLNPVFETFIAVFKPMLSKKLQERIVLHGQNMTSLYKKIDMSLLPDEYLPDDFSGPSAGSYESCIERTITEYLTDPKKRKYMKDLYSGRYRVDQKQRDSLDEAQASFRKLNVS